MGFNKRYIPKIDDLKKIQETIQDDKKFLDLYYFKPDALIGSKESVDYLEELARQNEEKNGL
jgi:hypothetical protein